MGWLSGISGALGGFMTSPALFMLGVAAIASPIIIHLLNKRKFKRVDWAAMDFLLEAEKKNRRRVRLENLLLLLLRCLACILIGLLLARPFISAVSGLSKYITTEEFERIVLVDDSPSTGVRDGTRSSMDNAKDALVAFVRGLPESGSSNSLTLITTSNPGEPIFNGQKVNNESAGEIAAKIEDELKVSDFPARLDQALLALKPNLKGGNINKVIYVVSDMRARDWPVDEGAKDKETVSSILRELANEDGTVGCYLVDVGRQGDVGNLVVEAVRAKEKALVAGVKSEFEIVVANRGKSDVEGCKVRFAAGQQSRAMEIDIPKIPGGGKITESFIYTFADQGDGVSGAHPQPVEVTAEIVPPEVKEADELPGDNTRFYAARVGNGVQTLLFDGDPSSDFRLADSFYLRRALAPPGRSQFGVAVKRIDSDEEFETLRLDDYQVIYLCNVYRISDQRRQALEKWVEAGGGLVIVLGSQVDAEVYNRDLYRGGDGLMPVELDTSSDGILGDEEEEVWVNFVVESQQHPVMKAFSGEGSPFLQSVKVFRWWNCIVDQKQVKDGKITVAARFNNPEKSPAIIEKQMGNGRVIVFATPLDADWSDWPQDHSYSVSMQETNRYMARESADEANVEVGQPLRHSLDVTQFKQDVSVHRPDEAPGAAVVTPPESDAGQQVLYQVKYDDIDRQGFYEMTLTPTDAAGLETVLFAVNTDPREGDLTRADTREFKRKLGDAKVEFVKPESLPDLGSDSAKNEWWKVVLILLVAVLGLEQFLGWMFGRWRQS